MSSMTDTRNGIDMLLAGSIDGIRRWITAVFFFVVVLAIGGVLVVCSRLHLKKMESEKAGTE